MTHSLILAGLSLLTREFAVAHPSKPSKGLLRAEVEKLLALVEGLPDEDAPAPPAVTDADQSPVSGASTDQSAQVSSDHQGGDQTASSAKASDTKATSAAS